ncbi:unnamed protein product [Rotaria socialis]
MMENLSEYITTQRKLEPPEKMYAVVPFRKYGQHKCAVVYLVDAINSQHSYPSGKQHKKIGFCYLWLKSISNFSKNFIIYENIGFFMRTDRIYCCFC